MRVYPRMDRLEHEAEHILSEEASMHGTSGRHGETMHKNYPISYAILQSLRT